MMTTTTKTTCRHCGTEGAIQRREYPGVRLCAACWKLSRDADREATDDTPDSLIVHHRNCGCSDCCAYDDEN